MPGRVDKYSEDLCMLGKRCSKKKRCEYLRSAPVGFLDAVGDIARTLLYTRDIKLTPAQRTSLLKHKKSLLILAASPNSKSAEARGLERQSNHVKQRKLLLGQRGGSILGSIWKAIKSLFSD